MSSRRRAHTYKGVPFTLPADLYGPALGAALDEVRAWVDAGRLTARPAQVEHGAEQLALFA